MAAPDLYDSIGRGYSATRRTDPRIAARIWAALAGARTVLNVGAGTGLYERNTELLGLESADLGGRLAIA